MIRDLNSRLDGIAKQKADLGLSDSQIFLGPSEPARRVGSIISRKTDPSIFQEDIVGEKIEEDTKMFVNWLTEEQKEAQQNVVVAAIVGMGGIGKTTLAKKIFNNPKIQEEFTLKIWACISKKVNEVDLLKCIIREAGGEHGDAQERSELVPLLQRLIHGKTFLLVLDDVWEESRAAWDELLRVPMMGGGPGSRLLVTTRDENVATGMKAVTSHRVKKLSEQDCWSLLIKQVFQNEEDREIQNFKDIGLQLIRKCDGLPLAIKSIGGVLCTKNKSIGSWQAVLNSATWSMKELPADVHHAFYLSFEDLTSPLKQCFIACSLYPEDYILDQPQLIYLWFAEGFLQDNGNMWELGIDYYRELLQRNLLEVYGHNYYQDNCKMHDLLWSFACYLRKDETFMLGEASNSRGNVSKLRRLSLKENQVNPDIIKKEKCLRTLFAEGIPENVLVDLCTNLSKLRILDLSFLNASTLPDSLCGLVHLRHLKLSYSKIEIVPESIGYLKNLVYLDFGACTKLSHIPQSIANLKQLIYINIFKTKVNEMPVGLRNLEKLIHLYGFNPSNNNLKGFSSLDELEALSKLVFLSLYGLERVSEISTVKRANLFSKEKLADLHLNYTLLSWEDQLSQTNEKKMIVEGVINELSPPHSLDSLLIHGYFGNCLPNWLYGGVAIPNLRYLYIRECNCFENLGPLGQLPNLDFLKIEGAYSIDSVGEELFGTDMRSADLIVPAFPKLNVLEFAKMSNWKEWRWNKGQLAMPKLKYLYIRSCPKLRSLPEGLSHHATFLEYLEFDRADNLTVIENFPTIKEIRAFRNPNLERISNLPNVSDALIEECPLLRTLENFNALQNLIFGHDEMEVLPEFLLTIMPRKVKIWCSKELLQNIAIQGEEGPEWHKFNHIPEVKFCSWDKSLYTTYQKTPFNITITDARNLGHRYGVGH